jgi:hypothetical protein
MNSQPRKFDRRRSRHVGRLSRIAAAGGLVLLCTAWAGTTHAQTPDSTATASSVAAVGLLPIHGITVDLDALAPANKKGKPQSRDQAWDETQKLWDTYLKGAGFNVLHVAVDVMETDGRSAERLARMCEWGKARGVRLAPNLIAGPEGAPLPPDYADKAAAFVGQVIEQVRRAGTGAEANYTQIMLYQLGRPLNHPASQGPLDAAASAGAMKRAAERVRATEQTALAGTALQPTPLLVTSSFDYELIRRGAIANTPMTDEAYGQSYDALRSYLQAVVGEASVEVVSVQWFPGSISADGADRLPNLVTRLEADLPGKLIVIDTGYSTAAGRDTAQARYYALAFQNLCDVRVNQGVDSPFAGIIWHSALDRAAAAGAPANAAAASDGRWGERATALTRMWNDPNAASPELRGWLDRVEGGFGMLQRATATSNKIAPKATYKVLADLDAAVARSAGVSGAAAVARELATRGAGVGGQLKDRLRTAMFGLLDAWLVKTSDDLFSSHADESQGAPSQTAGQPDIQIVGIGQVPTDLKMGATVSIPVSLFNGGPAPANNVIVYMKEVGAADLSRTNPTALSPGGTATLEVSWTPPHPGGFHSVTLEAYCDRDLDPSTNIASLGDIQVSPPSGGGGGGVGPKGGFHFGDIAGGVLTGTKVLSPTTTTTTQPGFVSVEGFRTPLVVASFKTTSNGGGASTGGSGTTSSARSAPSGTSPSGAAAGAAQSATMQTSPAPSGATPMMASGAPAGNSGEPVAVTFVNPFAHGFYQATATLQVNGKIVATRPLGTIAPHQRRTISFMDWKPQKAGAYRVAVDVHGRSPSGQVLTTHVADEVHIESPSRRTFMAPAPSSRPVFAARPLTPVMSAPAVFGTRSITSKPGVGAASPTLQVRGIGAPNAAALGLSPNSITLKPFPIAVGNRVEVSIRLLNPERLAATQAKVRVTIDGEDLGESTVDVPAGGNALALGFKTWEAKAGRHDVRARVTFGSQTSDALKPIMVMSGPGFASVRTIGGQPGGAGVRTIQPVGTVTLQPSASTTTTKSPLTAFGSQPTLMMATTAPDLEIGPSDLRVVPPSPAPGTSVVVPITVRNVGAAFARDARVLAVMQVDGREVLRQQFVTSVAARGMSMLEWRVTAPSGQQLSITATATVTGDMRTQNNQARVTAALSTQPRTFPVTPITGVKITR